MPTRSKPTSPSCGACSPGSFRTGPSCRSSRSPRTGPITTSTVSATTWPRGCPASGGRPTRRRRRRSGCRDSRRTCRSRCRCSWRWENRPRAIPFNWSVYKWLPGENANGTLADLEQAAVDLAAFVKALRRVDTAGAPSASRPWSRRPARGAATSRSVDRSQSSATASTAMPRSRSWEESLTAPPWDGDEVWVHGDLLPGNLLVVDGRLSAVIDFGGLNVGDPACDLQPAWNMFAGDSRARYRAELAGRRRVVAARARLGALPGRLGAAVLLGHEPGMIRQASTRAGAGTRRSPPLARPRSA